MSKKKQYTEEEIKNMSYWELWGLRREISLWYYIVLGFIYSFLIYAFIKVVIIFASKHFENGFNVDWWIIPILLLMGPLYYYGHEIYYKNYFLKQDKEKK